MLSSLSLPFGGTRQNLRTLFYYPEAHANLRSTAWLDGLRGVAAFEVLLYHWHLQFWNFSHNPTYGSTADTRQWWRLPFIRNFSNSGHTMVNVFFVISGFVLTHRSLIYIRSKNYDKLYPSISSAIFRRNIRIYLPTCAVSFFGMLLTYFGTRDVGLAGKRDYFYQQVIDWIYACRDFSQPFHDYNKEYDLLHRYQSVFWTLPLEIYGSIVCYITVMAVARITHPVKRSTVVIVITWFALVKANWWSANFLAGMLHADFSIWQEKTVKSWSTGHLAKYIWGIVFIWAFYVAGLPDAQYDQYPLPGFDWYYSHVPDPWKDIEHGGRFWWMMSGISLTVSISQLPGLKRLFEARICQYLGRISFMLYLVHSYVFNAFGKWWKDTLQFLCGTVEGHLPNTDTPMRVLKGPWWYIWYLGFWIVMLPVVLVVSGQVTKYIDDPSIQFAKWLEGKATKDDRIDHTASIPLSSLAS